MNTARESRTRSDCVFCHESEEVQPGIVLDFDANNQVVGVGILRVKARVPSTDLKQLACLTEG